MNPSPSTLAGRFSSLPPERKRALLVGGGAVAVAVLALLVTVFATDLYVRVLPFRVKVTPTRARAGQPVTVTWPFSPANAARYPFERISACPVQKGKTLFPQCRVVAAKTPNDGREVVRLPALPAGQYRMLLQALTDKGWPIAGVRLTSNGFRVVPVLAGGGETGGDGGGPGGGGGGGGGGAPPGEESPSPTPIALAAVPVISYFDESRRALKIASRGSWKVEVVDTGALSSTSGTSLAVDAAGAYHVAYKHGGSIVYATNASGSWTRTPVITAPGVKNPAVAVADDGTAHVSFSARGRNSGLYYATNAPGAWSTTAIESERTTFYDKTTIAITPGPTAHIVYQVSGGSKGGRTLRYATNRTGAWQSEVIAQDDTIKPPFDFAADATGAAHVVYADAAGNLSYASNATGAWTTEGIPIPNQAAQIGVAVDAATHVHSVYYGSPSVGLQYATNASGTWTTETVDVDSRGPVGGYPAIAIDDATGTPHVSYFDGINEDLKYATRFPAGPHGGSSNWWTESVDTPGRVGRQTDIRITRRAAEQPPPPPPPPTDEESPSPSPSPTVTPTATPTPTPTPIALSNQNRNVP